MSEYCREEQAWCQAHCPSPRMSARPRYDFSRPVFRRFPSVSKVFSYTYASSRGKGLASVGRRRLLSPHVDEAATMTDAAGFLTSMSEAARSARLPPHGLSAFLKGHDPASSLTRLVSTPVRARLLPSKSGIIRCSVCVPGLSLARGQLMAGWCVVSHGMRDRHTSRVMSREGVWND